MTERNLDFDRIINRKNTDCLKYDFAVKRGMPADVLPLWVADMDFETSSYIEDALVERVKMGIYGYSDAQTPYFEAVAGWMKRHHNWEPKEEWLIKTPGVVFALAMAVKAYTAPGDAVLIQSPVYYPFSEVIADNGRRVVSSTLVLGDDNRYHMDVADFEEKLKAENVKLFFLCNPHNPVGRVWTKELAFSVIFDITEKGEVRDSRIVHTVINSDRRFTYEEAQQIIETKTGDFKEEVLMLDTIAKALREKRFAAGAINFDRYEVKFEIDEKGKPISVYFKESKDANKLVEEFMLLANRTVAEKVGRVPKNKKAKVLPYRIHDLPDPEKLENLSQFIARFGYKVRTSGTKTDISKSINHLLDDIHGKKEENLIETVSIRAMQKARYSTHNIGHYGLAFDYYTHFTSPIRRFPDMMVHRLVTKYMDGGRSVSESKYEDLCDHSSNMEQIAANAERASIKYKQVEFMSERLGQVYDGVISGVTEWGLYVELNENKCEGMVPIRDLDDDYYEFDEKNYCLRGRRKNKIYSLGDAITIRVARANLEKKQLDFALIEK